MIDKEAILKKVDYLENKYLNRMVFLSYEGIPDYETDIKSGTEFCLVYRIVLVETVYNTKLTKYNNTYNFGSLDLDKIDFGLNIKLFDNKKGDFSGMLTRYCPLSWIKEIKLAHYDKENGIVVKSSLQ